MCLYWAYFGVYELLRCGVRAVLQAGDAAWLRVSKEAYDAGEQHTHWAYIWSPETPWSQLAMQNGCLPECHVWLGLPDQQQIVDFTTGSWPRLAKEAGVEWSGASPPKFFWGGFQDLPDYTLYRPQVEAIDYVRSMLRESIKQGELPNAKEVFKTIKEKEHQRRIEALKKDSES